MVPRAGLSHLDAGLYADHASRNRTIHSPTFSERRGWRNAFRRTVRPFPTCGSSCSFPLSPMRSPRTGHGLPVRSGRSIPLFFACAAGSQPVRNGPPHRIQSGMRRGGGPLWRRFRLPAGGFVRASRGGFLHDVPRLQGFSRHGLEFRGAVPTWRWACRCSSWPRVIYRRGRAPWALGLGTLAMAGIHPVGLLYAALAAVVAWSLIGFFHASESMAGGLGGGGWSCWSRGLLLPSKIYGLPRYLELVSLVCAAAAGKRLPPPPFSPKRANLRDGLLGSIPLFCAAGRRGLPDPGGANGGSYSKEP